MSGAEVAGLVLGAFPVVMSALESYRNAFEPLKKWWKFQRTFEDFIDDIGIQSSLFDNNLEKLLCPFVDSDTHLGVLLNDPTGPAWQQAELDEKLRVRLGSSYPFYKSIVGRMQDALNDLQALLGIKQGQALVLWAKRKPHRLELDLELRRFRISFSKKKFDQVSTLSKRNDDLARLLQTNDDLALSRKRRETGPTATILRRIQEHACNLHAALGDAWRCTCQSPHPTKLRLERRIIQGSMKGENWKILLALENQVLDQVPWQEMEVRVMEGPESAPSLTELPNESVAQMPLRDSLQQFKEDVELRHVQTFVTASLSGSTITSATSLLGSTGGEKVLSNIASNAMPYRTRPKKRVGFAHSTPALPEMPHCPPLPGPVQVVYGPHIQNMCSSLKSMDRTCACLGFLRDQRNYQHVLFPLRHDFSTSRRQEDVTLHKILQHQPGSSAYRAMTRQERFTVAVTLASSLLQLHSTPWIRDRWSKSDIFFHVNPDEADEQSMYQPFLATEFKSKNALPQPRVSAAATKFNPKTALSSLGIMLLELCFGKAIEDHPGREQYLGPNNQPNAFTDISTAKEWHEDVLGELGDDISDAIRRCLDCSFAPKPNMDNKDFQEAVFDGVVLPLQDLLKAWDGA